MIGVRVHPHRRSFLVAEPVLITRWLLRFVTILFVLLAARNLAVIALRATYPLPLDYSEGLVVSGIMELVRDPAPANVYSADPAFYGAPRLAYPPLFPYAAALLAWSFATLTGADPTGLPLVLAAARGLSLLSLLASAWLVYRLGRLWHPTRAGPAVAAGLFFCFLPVLVWGSSMRVDSLGLALTLAGLYLACRANLSRTPHGFWALAGGAVVLWVLAWFTKQSFIAAPLAASLYLLWARRWSHLLGLAALGGLVGGLLLGGLILATNGHYFWIITMERFTAWSASHLLVVWGPFLALNAPLILLALAYGVRLAREGSPPLRLLLAWGVGSLLMSLTAAKLASADYYLFETQFFLIFVIGQWWATATERPRWAAILAAQALLFLFQAALYAFVVPMLSPPAASQQAAARYIVAHTAAGQPIFSDSSAPLVAAGRSDQVFDSFLFRQLAAAGQLDGHALVADVAAQRFALILLQSDPRQPVLPATDGSAHWPPGFEGVVQMHYQLADTIPGDGVFPPIWIFVPKTGP